MKRFRFISSVVVVLSCGFGLTAGCVGQGGGGDGGGIYRVIPELTLGDSVALDAAIAAFDAARLDADR